MNPLVGSSIRRRKSAVKALERGLTPRNADHKAGWWIFCVRLMEGWDIDRIIGELLNAAFFGYQPAELTWVKRHDRLQVSDIVR